MSFFIPDIYVALYRFQAFPLRFFNWSLIKTLKSKWERVLNKPPHITIHSGIPFVDQMECVMDSECRGSDVTLFAISHSVVNSPVLLVYPRRGTSWIMPGTCRVLVSHQGHSVWLPTCYLFQLSLCFEKDISPRPVDMREACSWPGSRRCYRSHPELQAIFQSSTFWEVICVPFKIDPEMWFHVFPTLLASSITLSRAC